MLALQTSQSYCNENNLCGDEDDVDIKDELSPFFAVPQGATFTGTAYSLAKTASSWAQAFQMTRRDWGSFSRNEQTVPTLVDILLFADIEAPGPHVSDSILCVTVWSTPYNNRAVH